MKKLDQTPTFFDAALSKSAKPKGQEYSVVKRSGTLVPFHKERIGYAIEAAFRDTKKVSPDKSLDVEMKKTIDQMTDSVVRQLMRLAQKGASLTVEGIQDMVEVTLMKHGHHDVAKGYILYRDSRKAKRESSSLALKVYRKGKKAPTRFYPMRIASSLERAFRREKKIEGQTPDEVIDAVNLIAQKVVQKILNKKVEEIFIHEIEEEMENALMEEKFFDVARNYILHRAEKLAKEEASLFSPPPFEGKELRQFEVISIDGKKELLAEKDLRSKLAFACRNKEKVHLEELLEAAVLQFYTGMKESECDLALIFAAKSKIEKEPSYSEVAARLLLDSIYRETLGVSASDSSLKKAHQNYFKKYIKKGISIDRLSPKLLDFDLDELAGAIDLSRDDLFGYLGLQNLYDRYFIHEEKKRLETPQIFWMRVAMGLASIEGEEKTEKAIAFYQILSDFSFVSSTPTLFNSGTVHSQLSSCYLSTVMDDLHHIFKVIADDAQLSKWAGGLGNDWSNVRATGSQIKGTNGESQGVIPFLKVANDTAVAVNQCFAPDTLIHTARGLLPISQISVGDLVLSESGVYSEVLEKYSYNQKDPMLTLTLEHAIDEITVTESHPFYAMQDGKVQWIEAKHLKPLDYVAQVIPQEIVPVEEFSQDDAKFYGELLANGHFDETKEEWTLNCESSFAVEYLMQRKISFRRVEGQIRWMHARQALCEGASDQSVEEVSLFPFTPDDLYNAKREKRIAARLSHLPLKQTSALIEALLGKESEMSFTTSSHELAENLRYQLLRLGIASSGKKSQAQYEVEIASCREEKKSWFVQEGKIFTQVKKNTPSPVTPFVFDLKVEKDASYMTTSALAHNGGKRKGAMCAYLETWHLDIEDFVELRKNTGDERRRTHDMNTANWIPDLFMKRVKENGSWTLFSPSDAPDLHDLYGQAFEIRYTEYEKMADEGKLKLFKRVDAVQLWRKMLSMLFETGHPWITFKDPSNIRSPQDHVGVVHSSNLCTEILLNTSRDETAVCNLGSINLTRHVGKKGLDEKKLAKTVATAIRMLDNVIDINFYPIPEAKNANLQHRPIGMGIMGFQDALYIQNISYASHEAVRFADQSMEMISYYAILASSELAKERGTYPSYKGSKWDRGILPIDTIDLLEKERQMPIQIDRSSTLDWEKLRSHVSTHGMRNSNTMAIAPTATIGNIAGVVPSIEPIYKNLFVKSNLSGEFTITNPYLVEKLQEANLWDEEMIDDLKYFDGSIQEIERIPPKIKELFVTAFEIDPEWIIECAARRQKWIDMGQSLNLYLKEPSGKKLHQMYFLAWEKGLKTTYYLRSLGATQIEKSSIDINKRGLQPRWMKSKSASSNISVSREEKETPKACNLGEDCESCQ